MSRSSAPENLGSKAVRDLECVDSIGATTSFPYIVLYLNLGILGVLPKECMRSISWKTILITYKYEKVSVEEVIGKINIGMDYWELYIV
jgi:hypothetical protein